MDEARKVKKKIVDEWFFAAYGHTYSRRDGDDCEKAVDFELGVSVGFDAGYAAKLAASEKRIEKLLNGYKTLGIDLDADDKPLAWDLDKCDAFTNAQRIAKLTAALEHYADEENWSYDNLHNGPEVCYYNAVGVDSNKGYVVAQDALKGDQK